MGITRIQDQASGLRRLFQPDGNLALGQPVVHAMTCLARPALALPLVQGLVHAWADQGYGLAWVDELDLDAREDWPWPCRVRFDLSQSMLDHVPLSASFSALDERVWFAGARHMQRVAAGGNWPFSWPLSRRLQDSGVAFDAVYISVNPHSSRLWQVYGGRIHHTVVVGTAPADMESALRWMTQVPTDTVASWRLLLASPDSGAEGMQAQASEWITDMAAPLLGQPLEVLGPVNALWQGIALTATLPGVEAMRRVLLDRLMQE